MKRFFEFIGILTLVIGSILYSKEVDTVSVSSDTLMQEIKNKASEYKILPKEAIMENDTIIPGKNGKEVNVDKSYYNMKKLGYFDERELKYDTVYVKNRLQNNKNKYIIGGNKNERNVTLIFNTNKNLEDINQILTKHNLTASYTISSAYLENNRNIVSELISSKNNIINIAVNQTNFVWVKNTVKSLGQPQNYCLNPAENQYKYCTLEKSYILKTDIIKDNHYIDINHNLTNGKIFYFASNAKLVNELDTIINYIKSKGYKIIPLNKFLNE